jgi:hypothetical protein
MVTKGVAVSSCGIIRTAEAQGAAIEAANDRDHAQALVQL